MPQKILVVDQDQATLSLIETRLEVRDYEVFTATHSDEAVRLAQKIRFDLILIGSSMEALEGVPLPQKIKQGSSALTVPIVLLVGEHEMRELILSAEKGFDDFLIKPFDPFSLQLRVQLNLARSQERLEANPLTGLPGNAAIERNVQERVKAKEIFSVCYIDINHFKSFNDRYGFERGDAVIRHTAQLIVRCLKAIGGDRSGFVGHIGGDDFVAILDPALEERFAREFMQEFDRIIPTYYEEPDRKRRSVFVKNRSGVPVSCPLMSVSIAVVSNQHRPYKMLGEIASDAAEVKSYLKTQPGSHYLRDRREEPMSTIEESFSVFSKGRRSKKSKPLGQMLLEVGLVTEHQLNQALRRHIETKERIGQVLIHMKALSNEDLGRFLEEKLGISYVSLRGLYVPEDLLGLLGEEFIRVRQALPIGRKGNQLELAMVDPSDQELIHTVERMSECRVRPKLMLENEFDEFLEHHQPRSA